MGSQEAVVDVQERSRHDGRTKNRAEVVFNDSFEPRKRRLKWMLLVNSLPSRTVNMADLGPAIWKTTLMDERIDLPPGIFKWLII